MPLRLATVAFVLVLAACSHAAQHTEEVSMSHPSPDPTSLEEVRAFAIGSWESLSVELRPTEDRTGSGTVQPTRLKRAFTYLPGDTFTGRITMYGDDYGAVPLMHFDFAGDLVWGDAHAIADGAWSIDYVLNETFAVTPLLPDVATMLNQGLPPGMAPFEVGVTKSILKQAFPLFAIEQGQIVTDYDLIVFRNGLLFMGAKHVDGTPFDRADRRPHQLQIPLRRVK